MTRFRGSALAQGYRQLHEHGLPLPEMPLVLHVSESICTADHVRETHSHAVFEIVYVLSGRGERSVGDQRLQVGAGDIYIIRPGELHGARADLQEPYHFFAIGFDPAHLSLVPPPARRPALAGAGAARSQPRAQEAIAQGDVDRALDEAETLDGELRVLDQRVIHGGAGAEHIFRRLLAELDRLDERPRSRALSVLMVQALVVELLVFVTRCSIANRERSTGAFRLRQPVRAEFQDLLAWLHARLSDPPTLAQMAARVRLSPAHFTVAFKREVGQTPLEHLTLLRIEEGARRLADEPGEAITAIALDLGFSTSQYFSFVFRRVKGCSPRQWRARHRLG